MAPIQHYWSRKVTCKPITFLSWNYCILLYMDHQSTKQHYFAHFSRLSPHEIKIVIIYLCTIRISTFHLYFKLPSVYYRTIIGLVCEQNQLYIFNMRIAVKKISQEIYTLLKIAVRLIMTFYLSLLPCISSWISSTYVIGAPSQYKDRLIYVWRFPC